VKIIVVEEGTRSTLEFHQPVLNIGRAIDNDIRLSVHLASRHHCRIEIDDEGAWVMDLGSSNGTTVNGSPVERSPIKPGDAVGVGGAQLFVDHEPEQTGATLGETQRISPKDVREAAAEPVPAAGDFGSDGHQTMTGEARRERDNLRVFARITRALGRETELQPLLHLIVDSAVALVGGERGFMLLEGGEASGSGEVDPESMSVRVARSFDRSDIPIPSSRLSMGIAVRVAKSGRPLLSVDAGHDDRFSGMASVEDLRLRSVLCLPVLLDGRVEGVLYVDNRLQRGAFSEDDLDFAEMLAGQAGLAIRNARLVTELRERNQRLGESARQIQHLNEQLGRKIRDRDTELAVVRAELERERGRYDYGQIVGASEGMRRVFQQLDRIIETEMPVLIHGDSGTGKELVARAIHYNGPRKEAPFIVENCAALPDTLLESELFGHTRGAFTGADRAKKGMIEQADGGTLFLDEIGDMSPDMQKKLLRVLQEGEVRPLGSNRVIHVDVRLLAASHRNLESMVQAGEFREDLYYRINVLSIDLPPLRERREDIPLLTEALLARAAREARRTVPVISHEALALLVAYDWPGNVRELENEMRRVSVLAEDVVHIDHLSASLRDQAVAAEGAAPAVQAPVVVGDLRAAVASFERRAIEDSLARAGGNKSRAAKELGISRFALQRKLEKYRLATGADES
jgi:transcriptional regulator with GAF, ATPase, and Fis domain